MLYQFVKNVCCGRNRIGSQKELQPCFFSRRQETPEGIELQFATNVLGYFWLTQEFSEQLKRSAPARVINVASYWAGDLELDHAEGIVEGFLAELLLFDSDSPRSEKEIAVAST